MNKFFRVLLWVLIVLGTFRLLHYALYLVSSPSDYGFYGGLLISFGLVFYWLYVLDYVAKYFYNKRVDRLKKEKVENEKSSESSNSTCSTSHPN